MSKEDTNLVDLIEQVLPGWMRKKPYDHWLRYAQAISLMYDVLIDGMWDGRYASFPGQTDGPELGGFASVDALPHIGRDRRILQGPNEPPAAYAARLRQWRRVLRRAGTAFGILEQLGGILEPSPPLLRLVTSEGLWYSRAADKTFTFNTPDGTGFILAPDGTSTPDPTVAHPWDWDGGATTGAIWPIIYAPVDPQIAGDEGVYGDLVTFYGEPDKTIGTSALKSYVDLTRAVIDQSKAAGIKVPYIIVAFDPASFDPATPGPYPAAGMPDGLWGNASKLVTVLGRTRRVKSRLDTARYWLGEANG